MIVDEKLISHLEKLSRLKLAPEERTRLTDDLNAILQMVEKIRELDTRGVEPLVHLSGQDLTPSEDVCKTQISRKEALRNAPKTDGTYFLVPKIIEE